MRAVAIDFETANERRDSACAVGLAWIEEGKIVRRESRLIRPPELRFSPGNIRVHGILPADVRDQPSCAQVLEEFLPDFSENVVLAHNAGFDMGVLVASMAACGRAVPDLSYLCTLQISRRVFSDPEGCGLGKVAARLGIRFAHHDAGEDAYACAEIALGALRETGAEHFADLAQMLGLSLLRLSSLPVRPLPDGVAARALGAYRPRFLDENQLRFAIRGSRGDRYALVLEERRIGLYLRCSCPAGRNNVRCRHVEALLDGDVTDLVSGNLGDVERLRQRTEGGNAAVHPERMRKRAAV